MTEKKFEEKVSSFKSNQQFKWSGNTHDFKQNENSKTSVFFFYQYGTDV